jgi:ribosomal protein S18 acetylase RimI-like enzyme
MNLSYRTQVMPQDIENIRAIVVSTGYFHDYEIPIALELAQEHLNKGNASGYLFVFAESGGKTIAYSCYGEIACTQGSYDLYWIVTHNDYRGQGIGKRLLAYTEDLIRAAAGRAVYAETASRDYYAPTRRFYESCGYRQEAQLRDFYEPGDDKVIYVKRLQGVARE